MLLGRSHHSPWSHRLKKCVKTQQTNRTSDTAKVPVQVRYTHRDALLSESFVRKWCPTRPMLDMSLLVYCLCAHHLSGLLTGLKWHFSWRSPFNIQLILLHHPFQVSEPYPRSSSKAVVHFSSQEDFSTSFIVWYCPGRQQSCLPSWNYISCTTKPDSCERCLQAFVWSQTALLTFVLLQAH